MQADRRQACGSRELPEVAGQPVGGHWVAVEAGDHVAAVMVSISEPDPFGLLACLVSPQGCHRGAI